VTIGIGRNFAAGVAALVLLFAPGFSQAGVVSGTCTPTKVAFAASSKQESPTTSTTFVRVPQTTVSFVQGGPGRSCVLVQFSGHAFAASGNTLNLKAQIDGKVSGFPREFQFSADDPGLYRTRTVIFIFPNIAPGTHTLEIVFRSTDGTRVEIGVHNTIVHFAP
jgi:hypothetical protein